MLPVTLMLGSLLCAELLQSDNSLLGCSVKGLALIVAKYVMCALRVFVWPCVAIGYVDWGRCVASEMRGTLGNAAVAPLASSFAVRSLS